MANPAEEDKRVYHDRRPARLEAPRGTAATGADIARVESRLSGFATGEDIARLGARLERNSRRNSRRLVGCTFAIVSIGVAVIKWL